MKKYFLTLAVCVMFLVTHSQEKESVFFEVYTVSDSVAKGECTILTTSVFVSERNRIDLRFHELANYVIEFGRSIKKSFPFYGNSRITNVSGRELTINNEILTEYKFLEFGVCPTEDVLISSFELPMLQVQDSSFLTLKSDEFVLKVGESEQSSAAELVGYFELELINESLGKTTGDTSIFEYRIAGFGDLFHLIPDDIEVDQYTATTQVKSFYDSVYNSTYYRNEKTFQTKVVHKDAGIVNMEDVIKFPTYSPRLDRSDTLKISTSFYVSGEPTVINKTESSRLAVILDNSVSMELEDYVPHRFAAAQEFANDLLEDRSASYYLVSGITTEIMKSHVSDTMLNYKREQGTSLGNGLWYAIHKLKRIEGKKAIVLISDGDATSGNVNPKDMATLAKKYGIKIFTIGVGSSGKVPFGTDFFGRPRWVENVFDDNELKEVAKLSDGKYFLLPKNDPRELENIKNQILNSIAY